MFDSSPLMQTNELLERALDTESLRRRVISNNIANVDVPHFRRSEVNFESELRRAITERSDPDNQLPAEMTDERHIPFYVPRDLRGVRPRIHLDHTTSMRNDGNNVDIEKEEVDAAKNLMRYNAFVTSLNSNFRLLKIAMRSVV
ncbi:MAG: flagellar basal body rod protein FlgB [Spirochaetes bacterium]|nr:flagellar basal body rod protein FlgB [Spirochaetota bacterium]